MQKEMRSAALTPERLTLFASMLREQQGFRQEQLRESAAVSARSDAEAEVEAVVRRGAVAALSEIDAALARMQRGTYGRCTVCGGDIGIERLEILPQTARCISCERRR
jgi:RNA polymerase-binding transcription factor DksA